MKEAYEKTIRILADLQAFTMLTLKAAQNIKDLARSTERQSLEAESDSQLIVLYRP